MQDCAVTFPPTCTRLGRYFIYDCVLSVGAIVEDEQKNKMAALSSYDASYSGLLGLAETFRTSNPPRIKQCIQCLQSVFHFQPSPAIQARTHLQLGRLLQRYTKNTDMARSHLEKAVSLNSKFGLDSFPGNAVYVALSFFILFDRLYWLSLYPF